MIHGIYRSIGSTWRRFPRSVICVICVDVTVICRFSAARYRKRHTKTASELKFHATGLEQGAISNTDALGLDI